jgi:hypothetical protein
MGEVQADAARHPISGMNLSRAHPGATDLWAVEGSAMSTLLIGMLILVIDNVWDEWRGRRH